MRWEFDGGRNAENRMDRVCAAAKQGARTGAGHPGSRQPIGGGLLLKLHRQLPHCNPLTMATPPVRLVIVDSAALETTAQLKLNSRRIKKANRVANARFFLHFADRLRHSIE